ncbi:MAG: FAD-dependent oxidoreductase [Clostridiaceae bacterium]|nr:FAD-dependent oxidoreductase [Clostridiaceae bacterium]
MRLSDFSGLFKKSTAQFVRAENPFDDYFLVYLKPAEGTTWSPGEHAAFRLPRSGIKGRNFRAFSLASVPQEGHILLGTRTGPQASAYKQRLLGLKAGDPVIVHGPFGWFKLQDDTSPVVLFAAGVGITPIRALLLQLSTSAPRPIELVFASEKNYLFENEIDALSESMPQLHVHKTRDIESTQSALRLCAEKYGNSAYYYISAAPGVIQSTGKLLGKFGIKSRRRISDPFFGYSAKGKRKT